MIFHAVNPQEAEKSQNVSRNLKSIKRYQKVSKGIQRLSKRDAECKKCRKVLKRIGSLRPQKRAQTPRPHLPRPSGGSGGGGRRCGSPWRGWVPKIHTSANCCCFSPTERKLFLPPSSFLLFLLSVALAGAPWAWRVPRNPHLARSLLPLLPPTEGSSFLPPSSSLLLLLSVALAGAPWAWRVPRNPHLGEACCLFFPHRKEALPSSLFLPPAPPLGPRSLGLLGRGGLPEIHT
jgi:hypothetical protein